MPHSLHSILRGIFDGDNSAFRIIFESGGSSNAHSEHTIWRAVYDADNSALRVTNAGGASASFGGYLPSNEAVDVDWVDIPWNSDSKTNFTHTNGESAITFGETGNYIIMVNLVADYNTDNEIHYVKLVTL